MSKIYIHWPRSPYWRVHCTEGQLNRKALLRSLNEHSIRVGGCEKVFTPVRWRQVGLSCIKWRSTFFLYFFVRSSFGRQFVIRVDGCCANCVVELAFLPSGHTMQKQRHYDVRNEAITTSCAVGLACEAGRSTWCREFVGVTASSAVRSMLMSPWLRELQEAGLVDKVPPVYPLNDESHT